MIVKQSNLQLASSHQQSSSQRTVVEVGVGRAPATGTPAGTSASDPIVSNDITAGQTPATSADTSVSPQLRLMKDLVESLLGKMFELFDEQALEAQPTADGAASEPRSATGATTLRAVQEYREHEQFAFAARGLIQTEDGQQIEVEINLSMQRSLVERSSLELTVGDAPRLKDPLVINFNGRAAELTSDRFAFDLDADGLADQLPGLAAGHALVVIDRNGNGRIDDGREVLGALSGDAYGDLRKLDDDGNGFVDAGDAAFDQLGLWRPGQSDIDALKNSVIGALSTDSAATLFQLTDEARELAGQLQRTGVWIGDNGEAGTVQQLDFRV
ncbi:MAG: hypothetical protein ABF271_04675 [Abyssibacter sp.]|uniref:hypothetical protein n=1 Tax=Abyssibacter sp. TaxID=2320200 RepID=UPI00321AD2F9